MTTIDIKSMFEDIKDSLKNNNSNDAYKNFLKIENDKVYLVRLLINMKNRKKTAFHYYTHGFNSKITGKYVETVCLATVGERCPICDLNMKMFKAAKTDTERDISKGLRKIERHAINVYVVEDPSKKSCAGQVKILRYSNTLNRKIISATEGDDAPEFGWRVFDLSENGCNFKIKAESPNGKKKYADYDNSRFTSPGGIPGMTPEKMQEIYNGIFDLEKEIIIPSKEDVTKFLEQHYLEGDSNDKQNNMISEKKEISIQNIPTKDAVVDDVEIEDDIDIPSGNEESQIDDMLKDLF